MEDIPDEAVQVIGLAILLMVVVVDPITQGQISLTLRVLITDTVM